MPADLTIERGTAASWQPIYDAILNAIARHRLGPWTKLAEEEIAEIYGVSRTVVRAALQALARDGVVILQRNKGARIAHPTPEEARQIFEARAVVEPPLAALAAGRLGAGDAEMLRASIDAEHGALHADNPREAVYHSADFHRRIARLSGQTVLAAIVDGLLSRSSLVIALYWRQPRTLCDNAAHSELLDALTRGDGPNASELMRCHLDALLADLDLTYALPPSSDLASALRTISR
ncbi:GntR family transcriptional regulator [Aureimonas psammosilenae]|uniref:GntR family transcriptional regulator n=1 Tax=Aureimonas psammosilenae TaxID=2495496 RepID=UPI001F2FBCDA|nr:GntR family transcriptional regulator [Aureimonas psammosilenae]